MATVAPIYRPRYAAEATSPFLPENNLDRKTWPSVFLSLLLSCCGKVSTVLCASRRRAATSVASIALCCFVAINSSQTADKLGSHRMARKESYGLFRDVAKRRWEVLKAKTRSIRRDQPQPIDPAKYGKVSEFYEGNWPKDFFCPREKHVGEGSKGASWLCNPAAIPGASSARPTKRHWFRGNKKGGDGCLIYTSTTGTTLEFEKALLAAMRGPEKCEIHVFSPGGIPEGSAIVIPDSVKYHHWGFKGSKVQIDPGKQFKSLQDTVALLKHQGRTIEALVLDCMGCEWDVYKDLFNSEIEIMQIAVKLHNKPPVVNDFFLTLKNKGYATFHAEASAENDGQDEEYSFLKLHPEFFGE